MSEKANDKQFFYDSTEFAVVTATTNYDVKTSQPATAFFNVTVSTETWISTDQVITLRFNSTTAPAITMTSSESPMKITAGKINNIFITNNSGSTANVKIKLFSV